MIAINVANYYNDTKGKVVVVEWRVVANDGKKTDCGVTISSHEWMDLIAFSVGQRKPWRMAQNIIALQRAHL